MAMTVVADRDRRTRPKGSGDQVGDHHDGTLSGLVVRDHDPGSPVDHEDRFDDDSVGGDHRSGQWGGSASGSASGNASQRCLSLQRFL